MRGAKFVEPREKRKKTPQRREGVFSVLDWHFLQKEMGKENVKNEGQMKDHVGGGR